MKSPYLGFTLLELIVSLAIAGLLVGLVAATVVPYAEPGSELALRVSELRDSAIRSGNVVTLVLDSVAIAFNPDGSASPARIHEGGAVWNIDPWTGEVMRAPR